MAACIVSDLRPPARALGSGWGRGVRRIDLAALEKHAPPVIHMPRSLHLPCREQAIARNLRKVRTFKQAFDIRF